MRHRSAAVSLAPPRCRSATAEPPCHSAAAAPSQRLNVAAVPPQQRFNAGALPPQRRRVATEPPRRWSELARNYVAFGKRGRREVRVLIGSAISRLFVAWRILLLLSELGLGSLSLGSEFEFLLALASAIAPSACQLNFQPASAVLSIRQLVSQPASLPAASQPLGLPACPSAARLPARQLLSLSAASPPTHQPVCSQPTSQSATWLVSRQPAS